MITQKTRQAGAPNPAPTVRTAEEQSTDHPASLPQQTTSSSDNTRTSAPSVEAEPLPDNPKPRYPLMARKRGHEGRVVVQVTVLVNGKAANARVKTGSGYALLDRAALETVKRWRFRPAQRDGHPISAVLDVPVVFRLRG
ncbi:MAG: energy transducer TonB [Candidatus Competibacteraceae bacterium]